ncbi:HepT-like ribonuclease domain-containing protein [Rudanella lutea]|uniref:HepT-like ribonuclease domain-containing protein n=1 Tax=Rudanella lutea TaxID=451374 RepID=UPI000381F2B7|nr:HepT-like ribonuclease domain-containing protein [Rudanella lutea]
MEIAGEATKRLSTSLRERFSEVPWKDMAGMRDRLIHQYIDIDLMIVWLTVTEEATPLLILIEHILDALEREQDKA